jgi:uncharacterized protein (UPF0305 family)
MALTQGMIVTPDKKNIIIDALNAELFDLNQNIRNQRIDEVVKGTLSNSKQTLQKLLNTVLERKGVITPDETTEVVKAIEESKKNRLRQNYVGDIKKGVLWVLGFAAIGGLLYWYSKKA